MSWKADRYDKPSYRKREGGRIKSGYKSLPNKFKKCWRCHKRRISPYHHIYCEKCARERNIKDNNI